MRKAIVPEQRLVTTLRYFATGRSLQDLKFTTEISPQALGILIPETCSAIIQVLQKDYNQFPSNPQELQTGFLVSPPVGFSVGLSGSYYNYKGFCSIVMLAVVLANSEFIYLDV